MIFLFQAELVDNVTVSVLKEDAAPNLFPNKSNPKKHIASERRSEGAAKKERIEDAIEKYPILVLRGVAERSKEVQATITPSTRDVAIQCNAEILPL